MSRLAILAGRGALPLQIAARNPNALFVHFEDVEIDLPDTETFQTSYERFGEMFAGLKRLGATEVVFAGGLARPALNPANFDARMMELAPRFMAAMRGGDDALLRAVILAFEEDGFVVRGAHEVLPDLTVGTGPVTRQYPGDALEKDALRAREILAALGSLDVAQACVVAGGVCLGIETAQGTEAMLRFVAGTRDGLRSATGGVLVKRPKPGQDLRIDMPTIGPDTVSQAMEAGLRGIAVQAGGVIVLDQPRVRALAGETGIAVWGTPE